MVSYDYRYGIKWIYVLSYDRKIRTAMDLNIAILANLLLCCTNYITVFDKKLVIFSKVTRLSFPELRVF